MNASLNVIQKLLALQEQALAQSKPCLTIYRPLENPSKTIIVKELRASVLSCLKNNLETKDDTFNRIADRVAHIVGKLPIFHAGIGIFLVVDAEKPEAIALGSNLEVILSSATLPQRSYCGEIFDLSLAAKMLRHFHPTLILNISRDGTDFYRLEGESFEPLFRLENTVMEAMEERFTDRTPGTDGVMHSGSNALEKALKFARKHTAEVIEQVKKLAADDKSYQTILIFHSDDFGNFSQKMYDALKPLVNGEVIIRLTNVDAGNDPKVAAENILDEYVATKTSEQLLKAQTSTDKQYVEGWELVSEASRNARIQILYFHELDTRPGFIDSNNLPYVDDQPEARSVENVLPWLIKNVLSSGGEVVVLPKGSAKIKADVAAKLRY